MVAVAAAVKAETAAAVVIARTRPIPKSPKRTRDSSATTMASLVFPRRSRRSSGMR